VTTPSTRFGTGPSTASPATTTQPTSTSSTPATTATTAATTTTVPNPRTAAAGLATLLKQSVADRDAIINAVSDVSNCGGGLAEDVPIFRAAAASRASLIGHLDTLSRATTLPPSLLTDLHNAWLASEAADQDFAAWAGDEASGGCVPNDHGDPYYNAATVPDEQATAAKTAFVQVWNPIAIRFGLPTYSWQDL
jgi:hypothetical protein